MPVNFASRGYPVLKGDIGEQVRFMDYFGVLKRAWQITWKYKALWVLGFFAAGSAGSGGGGGGGGGGGSQGVTWRESAPAELERVADWFADNVVVLAAIGAVMGVLAIGYFILSVASRGGLVHEVNEAEERGQVSIGRGFSRGFHYWWRVLGISLVLVLPVIAVGLVLAILGAVAYFTFAFGGREFTGAEGSILLAMTCGVGMLILLLIPAAIIIGILNELAVRYGVLMDMRLGRAIKQAWADLWGKRGAFVMWLVLILPGLVFFLVAVVVASAFLLPAMFLVFAEVWVGAIALGLAFLLVMLVLGAVYSTFLSASWTVFFRRMTGLETPAVVGPSKPSPPSPPVAPPPTGTPGY